MKKYMAILLAICILAVGSACGKKGTEPAKNNEQEQIGSEKAERAFGESPEEIAILFSQYEAKMDMEGVLLYLWPGSDTYESVINDEDFEEYLSSGVDYEMEMIKQEYAEKGLTIADEDLVREYIETCISIEKYTVTDTSENGDEAKVTLLVENSIDPRVDDPDFSVLTSENADVDALIEERLMKGYYSHFTMEKHDGEWYIVYVMAAHV